MTTFDIHVAADHISPDVAAALESRGFERDRFAPGTASVVRAHYYSRNPADAAELERDWTWLMGELGRRTPEEFCGFAEAERCDDALSTPVALRRFDPNVEFPFTTFRQVQCPAGRHKTYDVHVVGDLATLDPRLDSVLTAAGFYVVDITRPAGDVRRCYTIQRFDDDQAERLHRGLVGFLSSAGGMSGKVKTEHVLAMVAFPKNTRVPPVVLAPLGIAGRLARGSDVRV